MVSNRTTKEGDEREEKTVFWVILKYFLVASSVKLANFGAEKEGS